MSSALTDPATHPHWPSWWYPPETDPADPAALGRIFQKSDDVPEGWSCNWEDHGSNLNRKPPEAPVDAGLSRNELKAELGKRDIAYSPTMAKTELQKLLDEAVEAERLEDAV